MPYRTRAGPRQVCFKDFDEHKSLRMPCILRANASSENSMARARKVSGFHEIDSQRLTASASAAVEHAERGGQHREERFCKRSAEFASKVAVALPEEARCIVEVTDGACVRRGPEELGECAATDPEHICMHGAEAAKSQRVKGKEFFKVGVMRDARNFLHP